MWIFLDQFRDVTLEWLLASSASTKHIIWIPYSFSRRISRHKLTFSQVSQKLKVAAYCYQWSKTCVGTKILPAWCGRCRHFVVSLAGTSEVVPVRISAYQVPGKYVIVVGRFWFNHGWCKPRFAPIHFWVFVCYNEVIQQSTHSF